MTRRVALGPWMKLYGDVVDRKAHYSDAQFRGLIEAWAWALRGTPRGSLPGRRAVAARLGQDVVDFLFSEGDLAEDGEAVVIVGWSDYQAPVDRTNAVRQERHRQRARIVDNGSNGVTNGVSVTAAATSTSISTENEEKNGGVYPDGGDDRDALDRYFELTGVRPWGRRPGEWLTELQETHGVVNVTAALEVEARSGDQKTLLGRVAARLERQAERVAQQAARTAEKARRAPSPEDMAMRAALAATGRYEPPVTLSTVRGGAMQPVGAVLRSAKDGSATSPVSGAGSPLDGRSGAATAHPADAVEANSFAPAPGPPPVAAVRQASTVEAGEKE